MIRFSIFLIILSNKKGAVAVNTKVIVKIICLEEKNRIIKF